MHNLSAAFVLAYHGCDRETGEKLLQNEQFRPSENSYDWLGSGIYFWEANPARTLDWAKQRANRETLKERVSVDPYVVGAAVDLGFCLDLIGTNGNRATESAYTSLRHDLTAAGSRIPEDDSSVSSGDA